MTTNPKWGTALITGASSGIGAVYADRLAHRGYDLILVARNRERLNDLAGRLSSETGRAIEVIAADLNDKSDTAHIEHLLRTDSRITLMLNNAGFGAAAPLLASDVNKMTEMINVNITALMRLAYAVVPGFVARGKGTIINIASVAGIAPEVLNGVYGATKAFVLAFSRSLDRELSNKGIRIQAVLPGATATGFWRTAGIPVEKLPGETVMRAEDMVDAALAGLDRGEVFTIPSLPDIEDWKTYEAAREKLLPNLSKQVPAARYRASDGAASSFS